MADVTLTRVAEQPRLVAMVLDVLLAPVRFIDAVADANAKGQALMKLHNMSDAELAKRGLTRDDIVTHVLGD